MDAVVKSAKRVPTASTTSARRARAFAALPPLAPTGPTASGWSHASAPLPAWVSATGTPKRSAKAASASAAAA